MCSSVYVFIEGRVNENFGFGLSSRKDQRSHAHSRPLEVVIERTDLVVLSLEPKAIQQREEVVVGRMGLRGKAPHLLKVHHGLVISVLNVFPHGRVEFQRPVIWTIVIHPGTNAEIVNNIPGTQNEDAPRAQGGEMLSQLI